MKLFGKERTVNTDIEIGILDDFDKSPEDFETMQKVIKAIIRPKLTDAQCRKVTTHQFMDMMIEFSKAQRKVMIDYKKKLSLL